MATKCPNINSPEFKALVSEHGINKAYALFSYGLNEDVDFNIDTFSDLNVADELTTIANKDSRLSKLAKVLLTRTSTLNDKIRIVNDLTLDNKPVAGLTYLKGVNFDVAISPESIRYQTDSKFGIKDFRDEAIVHETIHRYTSVLFQLNGVIESGGQEAANMEEGTTLDDLLHTSEVNFIREVNDLYRQYRKKSVDGDIAFPTVTDVSEFLAYGLTNGSFMKHISKIEVDNTTILDKLIKILKMLFGNTPSIGKTLEESFNNFIKNPSILDESSIQIEHDFNENVGILNIDDLLAAATTDFNIDTPLDRDSRRLLTDEEYVRLKSQAGLIGGLITPSIQELSVNNLVNRMITNTLSNKKSYWNKIVKDYRANIESIITKETRYIKEDIAQLKVLNDKDKITKAEKTNKNALIKSIKLYGRRVAVFEEVFDEVNQKDSIILGQAKDKLLTLKNFRLVDINGNALSVDNSPNDLAQLERTDYDDNFFFTIDNRKTMSSNLRLFIAGITKQRIDPKTNKRTDQTDIFDDSVNIDFNLAYEELHRLLAGLKEDFKTLTDVVTTYATNADKSKLWMLELVKRLKTQPINIQAEFTSNMTQHYVDMKMVSFKSVPYYEDGVYQGYSVYELTIKNANQSAMSTATINQWTNNLKNSALMEFDGQLDDYRYTISEDDKIRIKDKFTTLIKKSLAGEAPDGELLHSYLSEFGIQLEAGTIADLTKDVDVYKTLLNSSVKSINTAFSIAAAKDVEFLKGTNIIDQSRVRQELAMVNSKYTPELHVNSYNVGENSIQAYVNNKYAINRLRDLVEQPEGAPSQLLETLSKTVFTRKSHFLKELLKPSSNLRDWISMGYASLKPLDTPSSQKQRSLPELVENEHEVAKNGAYWGVSPKNIVQGEHGWIRKAIYSYLTSSDKAVNLTLTASAEILEYDERGNISNKHLDLIIDTVINSEWDRMYSTRKLGIEGNALFYFFPEMNDKEIVLTDGETQRTVTYNSLAHETDIIDEEVRGYLRELVKKRINGLTKEKLDFWTANNIGVNKKTKGGHETAYRFMPYEHAVEMQNRLRGKEIAENIFDENTALYYMSQEMTYNYMLTLANTFQLFVGDIALYYKDSKLKSKDSKATNSEVSNADYFKTLDNLGKRMASEIAPGYSLSTHVYEKYFDTDKYIQLYLNDFDTSTNEDILKYYKEVLGVVAKQYDTNSEGNPNINSTDAQEMTTWKEHLTAMLAAGRIGEGDYNRLSKILSSSNPVLSGVDLNIVLNPLKPVFANTKEYKIGDLNLQKRVYIKSSSFPLLPQLTKGLELDKLRERMEILEADEGMPVRVAYASAVKVGMPSITNNIYDENGKMGDLVLHDLDDNYKVDGGANVAYELLQRTGFRIQQDIPFDHKKTTITVGSQEAKLLFTDILGVPNFKYDNKTVSGKKLKGIYVGLLEEQYRIKYEKFVKDFMNDDGSVQVEKVAKLLIDELYRVDIPSISELKGLDIVNGEFVTPLWLSSHSKRYSSLMNSILNNKLVYRKTRGKSAVLASSTGFKQLSEVSNKNRNGIINAPGFNGDELLPMRQDEKTKEILPAQVLVPFSFVAANKKDKKLYIKNFVTKTTGEDGKVKYILDTDKLPAEILKGFGFRIPTQSRSSMSYMEIVGFLPENMGDIIVAPKEFIIQMGSDFDVDKLYSYTYNTTIDEDGRLRKITLADNPTEDSEHYSKALENAILDVHLSVLSNKHKDVQNSILTPLDFGKLPEYKKIIEDKTIIDETPTYLSSEYNRQKYMSGVAGQVGTAVFAQATVFNALAQDINMSMYEEVNGTKVQLGMDFGNKYKAWDGNLGNIKSLKKTKARTKSSIFVGFLSSAVDNEKERLLDALNINDVTFPIVNLLIQLGYEEDIILPFINQDIIVDYVKQEKFNRSILSDFDFDSRRTIVRDLFKQYGKEETFELDEEQELIFSEEDVMLSNFKNKNAEGIMLEMINNDVAVSYNDYQRSILAKFMNMRKLVKIYKRALPLANFDSKGGGNNLVTGQHKLDGIGRALNNESRIKIENINNALTSSPSGLSIINYIQGMNDISPLFINLGQADGFNTLMDYFVEGTGISKENMSPKNYEELNDAIKYYTLALRSSMRENLIKGEDSVKKRLLTISDSKYFKANKYLNKLNLTNDEAKSGYDGITFSPISGKEFTENSIYMAFADAISSNKVIEGVDVSRLMEDMVIYSILDGARFSPQSFAKYIHPVYFEKLGLNTYAKELDLKGHAQFIVEQYIQHHPMTVKSAAGKTTRPNGGPLKFKHANVSEDIAAIFGFGGGAKQATYVRFGRNKSLQLFKLNGEGDYVWIDMLGDGRTLFEYSKPSDFTANSVINQNKADTEGQHLIIAGFKNGGLDGRFSSYYNDRLASDSNIFVASTEVADKELVVKTERTVNDLGLNSNLFTLESDGKYRNKAGDILDKDQLFNLRQTNAEEGDSAFPYTEVLDGVEFYVNEDGSFVDSFGNKYQSDAVSSDIQSKEGVKIKRALIKTSKNKIGKQYDEDIFYGGFVYNQDKEFLDNRIGIIAKYHIARDTGNTIHSEGTNYFSYDMFLMGDQDGNLFSKDDPRMSKAMYLLANGGVNDVSQEGDNNIDIFTDITGATYLNELSAADKKYMLQLAAEGIIEINC